MKRTPFRGAGFLAFFCTALLFAGCSGTPVAHVSGKVLLADGKPVAGGTVTFYPQVGGGNPVSASIGADGSYDVVGVPVGAVKIAVSSPGLRAKEGEAPPMISDRQGGFGGPPKDVAQRMGPPKDAMKDHAPSATEHPKQPGASVPLDPRFADPEKSGLTYEVKHGDQVHNIEGLTLRK